MNRPLLRHAVSPLLMTLLAAGVIATGQASALSIGALNASSHLGEPLHARLVLDGLPTDHQGVKVTVTGRDSVRGQAVAWSTHIENGADGRAYLLISSTEKIEDPALTLRIEVHTPDGATSSKDQTLLLAPGHVAPVASNTTVTGTIVTAPVHPIAPPAVPSAPAPAPVVPPPMTSAAHDTALRPIVPVDAAVSIPAAVPAPVKTPLVERPHPKKKVLAHPSRPVAVPQPSDATAPVAATAGSDDSVKALNAELLNTMVRQAELQAEQLRLIQRIQQANAAASAALARQATSAPPVVEAPPPAAPVASLPAQPVPVPVTAITPAMPHPASTLGEPSPTVSARPMPRHTAQDVPVTVPATPVMASPVTAADVGASQAPAVAPVASIGEGATVSPSSVPLGASTVPAPTTPRPASSEAAAASAASAPVHPRPVHPVARPRVVHTPGVVHDEPQASEGLFGLGVSPTTAAGGAAAVLMGVLLVLRRRQAKKVQQPLPEDDVSPDLEHPFHVEPVVEAAGEPSMEVIDFGSQLRMPEPSEPSDESNAKSR